MIGSFSFLGECKYCDLRETWRHTERFLFSPIKLAPLPSLQLTNAACSFLTSLLSFDFAFLLSLLSSLSVSSSLICHLSKGYLVMSHSDIRFFLYTYFILVTASLQTHGQVNHLLLCSNLWKVLCSNLLVSENSDGVLYRLPLDYPKH